jgi:hypothetical protein
MGGFFATLAALRQWASCYYSPATFLVIVSTIFICQFWELHCIYACSSRLREERLISAREYSSWHEDKYLKWDKHRYRRWSDLGSLCQITKRVCATTVRSIISDCLSAKYSRKYWTAYNFKWEKTSNGPTAQQLRLDNKRDSHLSFKKFK